MANEVSTTVFGGKVAIADTKALAAKAAAAAQNNPRGGAPNGSDYLNFSGKRGVYTIGQEKRQIQPEELWVIDISSFEEGYVCWKNGSPLSFRMANIYTGVPVQPPAEDELGPFNHDKGDGWFQAKAMVMKSLDNEQQGYLRINSVSGVSAMAELIGDFSERAAAGEACWPVIQLDKEEFESQGFKNFKPLFTQVAWLDNDQIAKLAEGAAIDDLIDLPEPEPTPAPQPRGRRRP